MSSNQEDIKMETEEIQLLSLKPKHHNPPPKPVVSNIPDTLTPDIVWNGCVAKCFLYTCLAVFIVIVILIIHNVYSSPPANDNHSHIISKSTHHKNHNSNPHIIWFIFDDLGTSDISFNGASEYSTPHIDALAADGIQLSQHYVSPICSATRSALLTGTFAYKMGLQGVLNDYVHPSTISHIPSKYQTIANHLRNIGYDTRLYGKWHAGYSKASYTPTHRGFNRHIGYYQYAIDPFTKNNLDAWSQGKDWFIDGAFHDDPQYASDILLENVLSDLDAYDEETDDPLFMYISLTNPHFPVLTPDEFNTEHMYKCQDIKNEERRKYCLSVQYLDMAVGRVIETLKSNGLYDNSVIGMLSDNGPQILDLCGNPGEHIAAGSAYPLRGGKYTLFQGGVQTLAFISGGVVPNDYKGIQSNVIMSAVDWLPTWLHFTDFYDGNDMSLNIDGIDLYDAIFDAVSAPLSMRMSDEREYLILSMEYENDKYINTAMIYENHKLLINNKLTFFDGKSCNVRSADPNSADEQFASTIVDDGRNVPDLMLFDLVSDPNEHNDLLSGEGTANSIFKDDGDDSVKSFIVSMIKILDFERKNNVNEMRTQSFEQFGFEQINDGIPLDTRVLNGVHQPFQSQDEDEFPSGYDY